MQLQEWHCSILYQLHVPEHYIFALKLATLGIFTPWKLANRAGFPVLLTHRFKKVMEKILKMQIKLKMCPVCSHYTVYSMKTNTFCFHQLVSDSAKSITSLTNEWNLNTQLHCLHFNYSLKWVKIPLTFISELHSKCWSENIRQVLLPLTHCWASPLITAQP